jgi:mannose-6-phosphate isomerase-like protein (cupin superfamily)
MVMEKHLKKSEFWFVVKGECVVDYSWEETQEKSRKLLQHMHFYVPSNQFHNMRNETNLPCKILVMEYSNGTDFDHDFITMSEFVRSQPTGHIIP